MTTNFSRREFILLGSAGFGTSLLLQACNNPTTTTGGANVMQRSPGVPVTVVYAI